MPIVQVYIPLSKGMIRQKHKGVPLLPPVKPDKSIPFCSRRSRGKRGQGREKGETVTAGLQGDA